MKQIEPQPPLTRSRSRRRLRSVLIAAAAVTALTATNHATEPAQAATLVAKSGSIGGVGMPVAYAYLTGDGLSARLVVGQRTITESPAYANRDQWVCIQYRPYSWNPSGVSGAWTALSEMFAWDCHWIPAAYSSARFASWGTNWAATGIYWGFQVRVVWKLANNAVLGDGYWNYTVVDGYHGDLQVPASCNNVGYVGIAVRPDSCS